MVLDGQCSCSGVNTGSGKEHFTKRKTSKKKKNKKPEHQLSNGLFKVSFLPKSFQLWREEQHLITATLAYGMYGRLRLYQVVNRNCNMQNNIASPFLCHQKAVHSISTKHKSITIVESSLFVSKIFFSCFMGPIKKHVLAKAAVYPKI